MIMTFYSWLSMTSNSRDRRLCRNFVGGKREIHLLSAIGTQNDWASQIITLLYFIISRNYVLFSYNCLKCKLRIVSLEKSIADLEAFNQSVRCSVYICFEESYIMVL